MMLALCWGALPRIIMIGLIQQKGKRERGDGGDLVGHLLGIGPGHLDGAPHQHVALTGSGHVHLTCLAVDRHQAAVPRLHVARKRKPYTHHKLDCILLARPDSFRAKTRTLRRGAISHTRSKK